MPAPLQSCRLKYFDYLPVAIKPIVPLDLKQVTAAGITLSPGVVLFPNSKDPVNEAVLATTAYCLITYLPEVYLPGTGAPEQRGSGGSCPPCLLLTGTAGALCPKLTNIILACLLMYKKLPFSRGFPPCPRLLPAPLAWNNFCHVRSLHMHLCDQNTKEVIDGSFFIKLQQSC